MYPTHYVIQQVLSSPSVWEIVSAIGTLVAAVGTVGAFFIAFRQIRIEREARLKAENKEIKAKRRAQAELISSWITSEGKNLANITLMNNSNAPIYHLIVNIVSDGSDPGAGKLTAEQFRSKIKVVPPGKSNTTVDVHYHGMSFQAAIEAAFTDSFGNHWLRDGGGKLHEIDVPPTIYYDIGLPTDWR